MVNLLNSIRTLLIITFFISACTSVEPPCYREKGIKQEIRTVVSASSDTALIKMVEAKKMSRTNKYDEEGRMLEAINNRYNSSWTMQDFYEDEQHKMRLFSADYYDENQIDTTITITNDQFGRRLETLDNKGVKVLFTYSGCDKELRTDYAPDGTKSVEFELRFEYGVLQKTTGRYYPNAGTYPAITEYSDYNYDEKGHWISRIYHDDIKEVRTLEYY